MRVISVCLAVLLVAGCGDPMATVPRLSEQDIPEDATSLDALPSETAPEGKDGGLFAALFGGDDATPESDPPEADFELAAGPGTQGLAQDITSDDTVELAATEPAAAPQRKRRGLFGLFVGGGQSAPAADAQAANAPEPSEETQAGEGTDMQDPVQLASLSPEPEPARVPRKKGLFGMLGTGGSAGKADAAVSEIAPGTVLPYGRVARVCGLRTSEMGKKIASAPEKSPKYRLYDSAPGNTAPHTFFLTGFDDGCARQFTASLAVFGSVGMHEQLRYGLPAEVQPYSDTDKAYETLKSKVCKVPRRKPCGGKIRQLERDTVFLSIYERFDSNAQWTNLLLHGGAVMAQDRKSG